MFKNSIFFSKPKKLATDKALMIDLIKFELRKNNEFTHILIFAHMPFQLNIFDYMKSLNITKLIQQLLYVN